MRSSRVSRAFASNLGLRALAPGTTLDWDFLEPRISQRLILRNLALFATKVMPAFEHSFGHRIPVA